MDLSRENGELTRYTGALMGFHLEKWGSELWKMGILDEAVDLFVQRLYAFMGVLWCTCGL